MDRPILTVESLQDRSSLRSTCDVYMAVSKAQVVRADVYVADRYGGWQEVALTALAEHFDAAAKRFPGDLKDVQNAVVDAVKASGTATAANDKALKGLVIPFSKLKAEEATKGGSQVRLLPQFHHHVYVCHFIGIRKH